MYITLMKASLDISISNNDLLAAVNFLKNVSCRLRYQFRERVGVSVCVVVKEHKYAGATLDDDDNKQTLEDKQSGQGTNMLKVIISCFFRVPHAGGVGTLAVDVLKDTLINMQLK